MLWNLRVALGYFKLLRRQLQRHRYVDGNAKSGLGKRLEIINMVTELSSEDEIYGISGKYGPQSGYSPSGSSGTGIRICDIDSVFSCDMPCALSFGRRLEGAEVLILGCGLLSPVLTRNGIKEIEGVPLIDPIIIGIKKAEIMVDLYKTGIPVISRKGFYQKVLDTERKEFLY